MKDGLKNLYFIIIKLFKTIVSLFCIVFFNQCGTARYIRKQRIDRKGRAVSIIANGPSARDIVNNRRDLLKDTDLLVLNNFGNQDYFFELKPKYYILLDPIFFDLSFINKGLDEKTNNGSWNEGKKLKENFIKVDWDMTLLLPSGWTNTNVLKQYANNTHIKVVQYNATRVLGFDGFQNRMYYRGEGIPSSRNVIIPAMIALGIMGYKTIYLYGCEFSWTKTMDVDHKNGKMFYNDSHLYSNDENRYFGKGAYLWWLKVITEDLEATDQVAKFANKYGIHIVNRTKGSFIDSFDYENPDKL